MLIIGEKIIQNDSYSIKRLYSGVDELSFDIGISDRDIAIITEEATVKETVYGQTYIIKAIDRGRKSEDVRCVLDLDEWKATQTVDYDNESDTFANTVTAILPTGWTLDNQTGSTISRTIRGTGVTPLEVLDACRGAYSVVYQFDNEDKVLHAYAAGAGAYVGVFVSEELNLREINYKGKSTEFITALRARGANGLTFASINGGKDYVENHQYSAKMIWGFWKDERYEDAASLLAAATSMLYDASKPARSYDCDIIDLKRTDPEKYQNVSFSLFSRVKLIDKDARTAITAEVVKYIEHPYAPEKNEITLDTATPDIYTQVQQLQVSLTNPNSAYQQGQAAAITNATSQILSGTGGYVVMNTNADNRVFEILIMDTADITTATKVWRWNSGGLGYSSTGYAGTYTTAITQDGAIVADFISTGTLNAAEINVINLIAESVLAQDESDNIMTIDSGMMKLFDGTCWRAAIANAYGDSTGALVTLSGNTEYPASGQPVVSALLDANARLSIMAGSTLYVGLDKDDVRQGSVYAKNYYAGEFQSTAPTHYTGNMHTGTLYVKSIAPFGEAVKDVSWRQVNLSAGGTAWALCQD